MELSLRETDLNHLVGEVIESLSALVTEQGVEIRRPRPLPTVSCDPVLVREVFANLIANAVRYNDKASKWVEVSWLEPAPGEERRGPIFSVRDNGIGVRDRNFETVFQMFRRMNKEQFAEGSGAGLAIVRSIVDRHGGRIWLESVLHEGTTFFFTLR
jgi:light-regulated signal transduction histidine kinase (bacteriophytochrome)